MVPMASIGRKDYFPKAAANSIPNWPPRLGAGLGSPGLPLTVQLDKAETLSYYDQER
jgi:hypothetical protein